jgi:cobalamin biosynthesis protein CbiD
MRKFFFDMKDGVPMRDRVGIEFNTNAEAISYCKEIVQDFRDNSLRDDQDLEILVVNENGREIHREVCSSRAGIKPAIPIFPCKNPH